VTGRDRVVATLEKKPRDHFACMPITMMFAADCLEVKYGQYARDYRTLVDGQLKTVEQFDFDHVSAISDPAREASDCGAQVQWYEDQPPAIIEEEALLADKSALVNLRVPNAWEGERMKDRIHAIENLRQRVGSDKFVEGWVEGPCAEAADLRGINRLMIDFTDDPVFVTALFEFVVSLAIQFARAQIEAGADIIGVGDAAASLVGPRVYKQFVLPYEKKLVQTIHAAGGSVRLHICGNTRRILNGVAELGCEMVDLDYPVPMEEARNLLGPDQVVAGNLDPVKELRDGTPGSISDRLARCRQEAGTNYIVAAGCEIVRGTSPANVSALVEFARSA
jgi:MtaA/CmuA family methyltransferase